MYRLYTIRIPRNECLLRAHCSRNRCIAAKISLSIATGRFCETILAAILIYSRFFDNKTDRYEYMLCARVHDAFNFFFSLNFFKRHYLRPASISKVFPTGCVCTPQGPVCGGARVHSTVGAFYSLRTALSARVDAF